MTQTNWKNVKRGTKVLFRRSHDSDYAEGIWYGGNVSSGATDGAFFWHTASASGYLAREVGSRVTETDEWHVDEHYLKLAA